MAVYFLSYRVLTTLDAHILIHLLQLCTFSDLDLGFSAASLCIKLVMFLANMFMAGASFSLVYQDGPRRFEHYR